MASEVLADTYHDNFLRYSEVEAVNFWQSALEPSTVNVKPVYLNASAEYVNAESAVKVENVVGVLIDRDAAGYNLADDDLVSSPYNAKGQYYNLFNHVRIQLENDLTEKAVVFCIGGSVNPSPTPEEKIFEGEVTTVEDSGYYDVAVPLDTVWEAPTPAPLGLIVTIGDNGYTLPKDEDREDLAYGESSGGDPDFTNYPVYLSFVNDQVETGYDVMIVSTATAQTISIKVEEMPK